ncbi:MAG: hypothetical protein E3J71_04410 [Candidatus Stahlbacteria bacterium]|nr:MAG: hypothetical protein E3J71_04410 [Candidatus Stahlbacteria bacterium]
MKKTVVRIILTLVLILSILFVFACKKEAGGLGSQQLTYEGAGIEVEEPRWLIITYEGVYMEKIDVTGLEPGEDFVWIGYGTCEYPWQGEDSINLEPADGLVWANGKAVQANLRYVDLEEIPDLETILSVYADRRHLSLLKRFPNLVAVNLFDSDLCDSDLVHLASLTNLRKLDLWETQITDAGLKHLAGLRDLRWLNLSSTEITDSGFAQLAGLTKLRYLWLAGTGITNKSLTYISSFVNLRDLNLGGTRITNKGVKQLCGLTNLRKLGLNATWITDGALRQIAQLHNLRQLSLARTIITDRGLRYLTPLKNLEWLWIPMTFVTPWGVKRFRKALPDCHVSTIAAVSN